MLRGFSRLRDDRARQSDKNDGAQRRSAGERQAHDFAARGLVSAACRDRLRHLGLIVGQLHVRHGITREDCLRIFEPGPHVFGRVRQNAGDDGSFTDMSSGGPTRPERHRIPGIIVARATAEMADELRPLHGVSSYRWIGARRVAADEEKQGRDDERQSRQTSPMPKAPRHFQPVHCGTIKKAIVSKTIATKKPSPVITPQSARKRVRPSPASTAWPTEP